MNAVPDVPPTEVLASRSDAVIYLIGQIMIVLALTSLIVSFAWKWVGLLLVVVFGLIGQTMRTTAYNRMERRLHIDVETIPRWTRAWWQQRQLDRLGVVRRALSLVRRG